MTPSFSRMPESPLPTFNPARPVFLVGATASGKSSLALKWARAAQAQGHQPVILSMDSMQIYRGADIGTGKPTPEEQAEFPHGGLDRVDVGRTYDVAQYSAHAADFLCRHEGRLVFLVGGTGLYFRALTQGLCAAPATPPELREQLNTLTAEERLAQLRAEDPAICGQIDLHNPRRVQRALEVIRATGTSLLDWQARPHSPPVVPEFDAYFLQRKRAELHRRIADRVDAMLAAGWMGETAALLGQHGLEAVQSFAAIGYRDIAASLHAVDFAPERVSPVEHAALAEKIARSTRQYARRQLTWFRGEPTLRPWEAN